MALDEEHVIAGYEECMSKVRWATKTVGLWPLDDSKILPNVKVSMLLLSMVFFLIIPQTRMAIKVHDDLNLMLEVLTTADIMYYIALLKISSILYYKLDFKRLVAQIYMDWRNSNAEEQRKMWSNAKLSKWILTIIIGTCVGTPVSYVALLILTFKSNIIYVNGTSIRPLYVVSDFPFDTQRSPVYEIVLLCQSMGGIFSPVAFTAYDCIYVSSMLHFSGQLYNLRRRFENVVLEHKRNNIPFAKCLGSIIREHMRLVSYAEIIEDIFNKTFLLQVIATSVVLCLQGYQFVTIIVESNAAARGTLIFIIIFTGANLSSIFMYCFVAQTLRDESQALFYAAYQMNWYELDAKDAISVVLVMKRCLRPIEITVGKFAPLTLEYFTKVMKTSVGYLSFLLAVRDQLVE